MDKSKIANISEMGNQSETDWTLGLGCSCKIYMGYFWPFSVQGHFWGHSVHLSQMACNSKMAGHRLKRSEIRDLEVILASICGTFDLSVFKFWGVTGLFSLLLITVNVRAPTPTPHSLTMQPDEFVEKS